MFGTLIRKKSSIQTVSYSLFNNYNNYMMLCTDNYIKMGFSNYYKYDCKYDCKKCIMCKNLMENGECKWCEQQFKIFERSVSDHQ